MDQWVLVTSMIAAYLGLTLWVGLRVGRGTSSTVDGFVADDRNFGFLVMYFVTGATVFSSFAFPGGPGWAYSRGAAAFYILSYGVLGMAPWYMIGPKVARIGRQLGQVTQAQFLTGRFRSRGLSLLIALISIAALFWRRATTPGVIAGLLAGGAAALLFFFVPELKPLALHEGMMGLFVHVPVLMLVSLLTPAQDAATVDAYVDPPPRLRAVTATS